MGKLSTRQQHWMLSTVTPQKKNMFNQPTRIRKSCRIWVCSHWKTHINWREICGFLENPMYIYIYIHIYGFSYLFIYVFIYPFIIILQLNSSWCHPNFTPKNSASARCFSMVKNSRLFRTSKWAKSAWHLYGWMDGWMHACICVYIYIIHMFYNRYEITWFPMSIYIYIYDHDGKKPFIGPLQTAVESFQVFVGYVIFELLSFKKKKYSCYVISWFYISPINRTCIIYKCTVCVHIYIYTIWIHMDIG